MTSKEIANLIEKNYLCRINELDIKYQFHFYTRLFLYTKDEKYKQILLELKKKYLDFFGKSKEIETEYLKKNKRTSFFKKYSKLLRINKFLFHILFMKNVFNEDEKDLLLLTFDQKEIALMIENLLKDNKGISTMSTHAMNFLYLYNKFYKNDKDFSLIGKVSQILDEEYSYSESEDLNNLVYLTTHCIINETLFYFKNLPIKTRTQAKNLLIQTEKLVEKKLDQIKSDALFEFLVCCKILKHKSVLKKIF